jgi:hypothetical protein
MENNQCWRDVFRDLFLIYVEKKEAGIANLSCKTLHHAVGLKDLWASSYEVGI